MSNAFLMKRVSCLAALVLCALSSSAAPGTGDAIFNGKDLTGWTGNPKLWSVKDGAIVGQTTAAAPIEGNTFLIWTNGAVGDFELHAQFKITADNDSNFANSGIQYRSKILDTNKWVVGGYQADMEAGSTYTGILYEERMTRGIMAARGEKVTWDADCQKKVTGSLGKSEDIQASIKKNDWNDYVVIAKGNHLQHFINGKQTVDVIDDCESKRAMTGVLALQLHAGKPMTVQFRNLHLQKGGGEPRTAAADDLRQLQGTWQVVSAEQNGEPVQSETLTNILVIVTGTSYRTMGANQADRGTFTIDPSQSPKQMDLKSGDGEALAAIYELGPDHMRVCYGREGADRPTSFTTSNSDARFLMIDYKRKKN